MTRTTRNIVLSGSTVVAATLVAAVIIARFVLSDAPFTIVAIGSIGGAVVGIAGALVLHVLFRRSGAVSIFFVAIALLLTAVHALRPLHAVVPLSLQPGGSLLLVRVVIAVHLAASAALFASGLFAYGVRTQRHGTMIALGLGAAALLAWAMPLDSTTLPATMIYRTTLRFPVVAISATIAGMGVVNHVIAALQSIQRRRVWAPLGLVAVVMGREILYGASHPAAIASALAAIPLGVGLFALSNYRDLIFDDER